LWIQIRSDPILFAGSGTGVTNIGSGSDKLQFLMTTMAGNLLRNRWILTILL